MSISTPTDNASQAGVFLRNVNVVFPIYSSHGRSLKRSLVKAGSGNRIALNASERLIVNGLQGIDLSAEHGDRIGLVGRNGSGKSTLLRAIAGVYEPEQGTVTVRGKVASLIDINLGLDIEASGYENIRIRCLLLGQSDRGMADKIAKIAEVTELGDFLEMPVRTYSSGMVMRLGFAISTAFVPDVLLMDEWIGVGDSTFVEKAQNRLQRLVGETGILFIASHNADIIRKTCNRVIWLDQGMIRMDGTPDEVIAAYDAEPEMAAP
ncbi:ABC transporter ATP-binding protein [Roseobacter sp.]|uniref:ABC transporter ATP-binding protein n=1 Tax=Roseobacter sp. TaxID=1907202 RepID=UPI003297DA20